MIRMLIADDHTIMREGLKQLFTLVADLQVVAEAESGAQVIELLRQVEIDLLLLDMNMPGISGEILIARLHAQYPKLPILVLSMHNEIHIAQRALRAGALGYLTKDSDPETLLAAIRRVIGGQRYLDAGLAEQIALQSSGLKQQTYVESLSDREFQILRLLAHGMSVNQIAEQLVISNKTVSTHKTRLMEKMGFVSTADIVRFAMTLGIS
ncbi:response regulator transcription factor [Pseudomonas sp. CBSPBW29]|jgi:DNA-binding NarL/FixJ family response regulator|uniref:response regulator n=1 Tax=Pseudomonas TaxID=286 RepID=UPI0002D8D733|nr:MULTISPECIES: response regulator transcription factor [unclassified Pseudomonas]WEL42900.1 response regulator transcription factor [Pseudomonas sp. CBSPBW29]WEL63966.1 response regulator transcription factor [Pseudomonas sp. CBSPGW29]WEL73157.1 response regulator transcription factor [Pseudomonas sp. CBSPCGW29]WEL74469.1 response regulator transcription factor [Pseudomonas sp. CBSPAW29]WEL81296.1 response regulator transcription factor [Pseudomonas sp. CBSPCAW29]WEL89794.1 response regulat